MPPLSRSQLVAYCVIAVALLAIGGRWLAGGHSDTGVPPTVADTEQMVGGVDAASPVEGEGAAGGPEVQQASRAAIVHVAGAVRRPGVYRLGASSRVRDAVRRAGGPTDRADVNAINLAALVQDGVQVVVPRRGPPAAAPVATATAAGAPAVPAVPVNLNSASAEELQTLDGVGPATAADILEYRAKQGGFRSVEDLDQVPGIGPKTMEALRDRVTV